MKRSLLQSALSFSGPAVIALLLVLVGLSLHNSTRALDVSVQDALAQLDGMSHVKARADALATIDPRLLETRKALLRTGTTQEIVGSDVLAIAQQLAAELGLPLGRFSIAVPEANNGFDSVAVTLELSGASAQVYGMIEKIEAVRPPLLINRLRLQSMSPTGSEADADTVLMMELTLEAAIQLPAKGGT